MLNFVFILPEFFTAGAKNFLFKGAALDYSDQACPKTLPWLRRTLFIPR